MTYDAGWVAPYVDQSTAWLDQSIQNLPQHPPPVRIEWQRDGLVLLWQRQETLKLASAQLGPVAEDTARLLGNARAALREIQGAHDDLTGAGLEAAVSTMAARGMAADERRIAHDTKALPLTIARRRLERLIELLDAHRQVVNQRLFAMKDERNDIRVQFRAIDVGIEVGEL